jgi:hypothetical protein
MAFVNHFYNATTRKYVALFGSLFNKISITRDDLNGDQVQRMVVPIAYGPWQKFLSRITQDPELNRKTAISLPRMSFEITNMTYDGVRKIGSKQKLRKELKDESEGAKSYTWSAAPYNIDFSLYIMTKYSEDAVKIVEQIIPFFKPEWTTTVKLIPDLDPIDIPLVLNGVTSEELYEGSYEERKSILWTLNFTMKCWYFGPERQRKVIKFVDAHMFTRTEANATLEERVIVRPGLTANGSPTTDANNSISWEEIQFDDDWGVIRIITTDPDYE